MTKEKAIEILIARGHDTTGATEIVETLIEADMLESMTSEDIIAHSMNYYEN